MTPFEHHIRILSQHQQIFLNSCCASGMEMILKLHDKMLPDLHEIQERYKGQHDSVGFGKLADLEPHVHASDSHLQFADFFRETTAEAQAGRFPIFSTRITYPHPQGGEFLGPHHVFVCIWDGSRVHYISRSLDGYLIAFQDLHQFVAKLRVLDSSISSFHTVRYTC